MTFKVVRVTGTCSVVSLTAFMIKYKGMNDKNSLKVVRMTKYETLGRCEAGTECP